MDATKLMYVVKVNDPSHEAFGQYYGGFNKGAERPYYVKKITKAKWYSNARDIYLRDYETLVAINLQINEDMVQENDRSSSNSYSNSNTILTSSGISLNAFSAHSRHIN